MCGHSPAFTCGADADIVLLFCVQLVYLSTDYLMNSLRNSTFVCGQ